MKLYCEKSVNCLDEPAKKVCVDMQSGEIQLSLFSSLSLRTTTTFLREHCLFTQKTKTLHGIFFLLSTADGSDDSPFSWLGMKEPS